MAIICIAGTSRGIGKTAVAEFLLGELAGWHAARVRVADEIPERFSGTVAEEGYRLLAGDEALEADPELRRLQGAGAEGVSLLMAEARGLETGLRAMLADLDPETDVLVEGNAFLWARHADVSVMVVGAGPTGKGLGPVRPSVRELFEKIDIWAWNTRADPNDEGFFEFPMALGKMGFRRAVTNRADYHHVNPRRPVHDGNPDFVAAVRRRIDDLRRLTEGY
jgi:NAD(P)-dependent dehydrogenase (short-subunit alcohol dehydrogenase family)